MTDELDEPGTVLKLRRRPVPARPPAAVPITVEATPSPRPQLREVRALEVPLHVPHDSAVAYAQRTADLTRLWTIGLPQVTPSERGPWGDVLALGIAMAMHADLGVVQPEGEESLAWALVRAVWPGAPNSGMARAREALNVDAPRYQPPNTYLEHGSRCPVEGPRGGTHRGSGPAGRHVRWVTDMATGAWEDREVCGDHLDVARLRAIGAPDPAPNRGGLLLAVFSDSYNVEAMYRSVREHWVPPNEPQPPDPVLSKPVLTVVTTD